MGNRAGSRFADDPGRLPSAASASPYSVNPFAWNRQPPHLVHATGNAPAAVAMLRSQTVAISASRPSASAHGASLCGIATCGASAHPLRAGLHRIGDCPDFPRRCFGVLYAPSWSPGRPAATRLRGARQPAWHACCIARAAEAGTAHSI